MSNNYEFSHSALAATSAVLSMLGMTNKRIASDLLGGASATTAGGRVEEGRARIAEELLFMVRDYLKAHACDDPEAEDILAWIGVLIGAEAPPMSLFALVVGSDVMRRALQGAGITTVEQLRAATDDELLAIRGIGPGKLKHIRWYLKEVEKYPGDGNLPGKVMIDGKLQYPPIRPGSPALVRNDWAPNRITINL